jgi:magnesium-protoporphyrin IX monomethyl ester (oxidative) cyclase
MYLNDHSRTEFYESIGLDTTQFNMHVIHQTNKTTAQIFPQVIDTYNPKFKEYLDNLRDINAKLSKAQSPMEKAPLIAGFAANLLGVALMKPVDSGSIDFVEDVNSPAFMY